MTSNLAQREIAAEALNLRAEASQRAEASPPAADAVDPLSKTFKRDVVHPILRRHFGRDEFIGRINEIVFFLPFTEREQEQLVQKELALWAARARKRHGIDLRASSGVVQAAAHEYDMRYGARSIKYAFERMCIGPVAREHEAGVIVPGSSVYIRTAAEDALPISSESAAAGAAPVTVVSGEGSNFVLDVTPPPPAQPQAATGGLFGRLFK